MFKESHGGTTAGYWHAALLFVGTMRTGQAGQWQRERRAAAAAWCLTSPTDIASQRPRAI